MLGSAGQRWIQPVAASVLIAFGVYTATSRASIDLGSMQGVTKKEGWARSGDSMMVEPTITVDTIKALTTAELPCCEHCEAESEAGSKVGDRDPDGE